MNVGIDLGTTNSALAFIDPKEAAETDFPPIHVLDIPQYRRAGTRGGAAHAAVVPVFGRSGIRRRLCARAGRAGADEIGPLGEDLAVESGCRSHGEDSAVGCAGRRARAVAGGSFGAGS